jgi:hypothetical protein
MANRGRFSFSGGQLLLRQARRLSYKVTDLAGYSPVLGPRLRLDELPQLTIERHADFLFCHTRLLRFADKSSQGHPTQRTQKIRPVIKAGAPPADSTNCGRRRKGNGGAFGRRKAANCGGLIRTGHFAAACGVTMATTRNTLPHAISKGESDQQADE